jgi:hypothetical protein
VNTTVPSKRNGYTLETDLMPILEGKVALPNFKEVPLERAAANIASSYGPGLRGHALLPGETLRRWAQFFFDRGQGGGLHGSGLVIYYTLDQGRGVGAAGTFAICDHKAVEGAGANHSRGWHPATCSKCGLDMSVDSGD